MTQPALRASEKHNPLEQIIGLKLAGWVGAIVLVIGAGFGIKFAYDQGWLGMLSPTLRLLVVDGINGSRIVDDSYNASPESVLAALNLLNELPGRRKIGASASSPRAATAASAAWCRLTPA